MTHVGCVIHDLAMGRSCTMPSSDPKQSSRISMFSVHQGSVCCHSTKLSSDDVQHLYSAVFGVATSVLTINCSSWQSHSGTLNLKEAWVNLDHTKTWVIAQNYTILQPLHQMVKDKAYLRVILSHPAFKYLFSFVYDDAELN